MVIFRCSMAGFSSSLIDLIIFNLILRLKSNVVLAKAVSYTCGSVNSFFVNKYFTFKKKNTHNTLREFIRFVICAAFSLSVNLMIIAPISAAVRSISFLNMTIADNISNIAAMCITFFINFAGMRFVVFRGEKNEND